MIRSSKTLAALALTALLPAALHAGGPGNGGGNSGLRFAVQPNVWNTNWDNAAGTVAASLHGDVDAVDPASVTLAGSDPAASPLAPSRVQATRHELRAFFEKAAAIALLDTPAAGEVHTLTLSFTDDGVAKTLDAEVRVVGPPGGGGGGDDDEIGVLIQPQRWNTQWANSQGTVMVILRGDAAALDEVALASIQLTGTDDDKAPISPLRVRRLPNHIRAFFAKRAAIAILDTPRRGETHVLTVSFGRNGATEDHEVPIRIVGPPGGG